MTAHPAKFSKSILQVLHGITHDCRLLLDPFAGTGLIHQMECPTVGIEIEPEWATLHPGTIIGNALTLPFRGRAFDCVATSCTYGNRMADHHHARDNSKRNTYRHTLGRELHPQNSGKLQWGTAYREFHLAAWNEVKRVLEPGGRFILNVSNHIRKGQEVDVAGWHRRTIQMLGLWMEASHLVATRRQRQGANGNARVPYEVIYIFRKAL